MAITDLPTWNPSQDELEELRRKKAEQLKKQKKAQQTQQQLNPQPAPTTTTPAPSTPAATNVSTAIAAGQDSFTARFEAGEEDTTEDSLAQDEDFLAASRNVYKFNHNGQEFDGTDQELADYALDTMGWFNYNLPKMTVDAAIVSRADDNTKASFLYLMEAYDDKNISWDGTWRFIKGVGLDPTTYAGLATFGIGTAAATGGKVATKEGLKAIFKGGMRNTAIAGIEGGIYAAVDDINRQVVETSVTGDDMDLYRTGKASLFGVATAGAVGFAATPLIRGGGAAIGKGTEVVGKGIDKTVAGTKSILGIKPKPVRKTKEGGTVTVSPDIQEAATKLEGRVKTEGVTEPKLGVASALMKIREAVETTTKRGVAGVDPESGVQKRKALGQATQMLTNVLKGVTRNADGSLDGDSLNTQILGMQLTQAEFNALSIGVQRNISDLYGELATVLDKQLNSKDLPEVELDELTVVREEIEDLIRQANVLDEGFRATAARSLGSRQEFLYRGELLDTLPDDIKADKNISDDEAVKEFLALYEKQKSLYHKDTEIRAISGEIDRAIKQNRIDKAFKLSEQRRELIKAKVNEQNPGIKYKIQATSRRTIEGVNEFVIGTVFTGSTIVVNTIPSAIKTAYKPFLNFIVEGDYSSVGMGKLVATYGAMGRTVGTAGRAAIAAYKYERSMLTGDYSKFMENHNILPQRYKKWIPAGSVIRFFPNVLNMTDEFFAQVNYRGFVEGKAVGNALAQHQADVASGKRKKPLKGAKLDAYVKKEVDKVILKAFDNLDATQIKSQLLEQAKARGMNAVQAKKFVADEFKNNESLFARGVNREGRSYTEDLLFKRQFSGEGLASGGAAKYEQFVKDHPWMKIMGQLFFRTPVRVFEEGIRMTPGLQLIAPKYLADLRGSNGTARQVRAQGEALLSYAIAGYVMMQYAQGNMTGSGSGDYKRRKMQEDTDRQQPYTMKFDDGSTFSYKNYDPFATPIKILVNAFERYEEVEYRRRQGEYVDDEMQLVIDRVTVSTSAIFNAIKDANLMQGVAEISDLLESAGQEENVMRDILKYLGKKGQLAFPNLLYKTKNAFFEDEPTLKDPRSFLQYLEARMDLGITSVSNQYDTLGNPRLMEKPMNSMHGIFITDAEDRRKGKSDEELFVLRKLELMAIATDSSFETPKRIPSMFGDTDLAALPIEEFLKDQNGGNPLNDSQLKYLENNSDKTLFDRYNEIYRDANGGLVNILYPILSNSDGMYGTASQDGAITQVVRSVIAKQRQIAAILLLDELGKINTLATRKVRQAEAKAGLRDDTIFPNVRD